MDNGNGLPFVDYMHFPDYTADLEMLGGGKEGRIKERLKNILVSRLKGYDLPLTDFFDESEGGTAFDADPIWLNREHHDGWRYYHLEGMSGNYKEYANALWLDEGYNCYAALWLSLLSYSVFSDLTQQGGEPLTVERVSEYLSEYVSMWDEVEPPSEEEDAAVDTIYRALMDIRDGHGLSNDEVKNFIGGINDSFGGVFSDTTILENIELFTDCLSVGLADNPVRTVVISSSEVFEYRKYRERVPEDLRRDFDNALLIFENPLPGSLTVREDNKEEGISSVGFVFSEDYCNPQTFETGAHMHPLYTEALKFLINNLPVLRKEYGDAPASPVLFLCFSRESTHSCPYLSLIMP